MSGRAQFAGAQLGSSVLTVPAVLTVLTVLTVLMLLMLRRVVVLPDCLGLAA
jgi:hypothetical protein